MQLGTIFGYFFSHHGVELFVFESSGHELPPKKRVKVFKYLKKQWADIACLQEMHFSSSSCPKYFDAQYPQVFLANGPTKQRGMLIAIHKSVQFSCSKQIADPNGRYLLHPGTI